ncbi:hypothetical protein L1887_40849 [Cichorium endivia]|nr:hypothetical protein L1887_40849 [Cichorium endivia]
MLVSKINPCMFKKLVVGLWVGSAGPPSGVHRFTRPFCRRCAPGLNWPGRASGAVTLKKLECSKQAYALRTTAKAFAKDVFINQERKLGARRRSDTVLVSTINDVDQGSADVAFRTPLALYEKSKFLGSGGSMVARLKLKGIDGRAPPGVCDALRCSGPQARYTDVFNEYIALADRPGKSLKFHRDGDRSLQLLVFNEEFLVSASHQLALTTSLPFVHTARRSYRLNGPVKC